MNVRGLAVGLAVLIGLAGCTGPASAGSDPVASGSTGSGSAAAPVGSTTIGLSYIPNVQFSPFYLAEKDGEFTKSGVDATLRHHGASEGLFTAIAAGQEQFVVAGGDELLQARAQGIDLVAVASYYRSYPVVLIVPQSSSITSLAQLKGHSIGIPGKYGESWFGLQVALRTAGLSQSDVTIDQIGYTQRAALTSGKVDAIVGFSNNDAVQFAQAGFPVRTLPIAGREIPLVGASLVTTAGYAHDHPEVVKAVISGMLAGINAAIADPDRALQVSADYVPGLNVATAKASARATLLATTSLWAGSGGKADGVLVASQWRSMADFMLSAGLIGTKVDPTLAMTDRFLKD